MDIGQNMFADFVCLACQFFFKWVEKMACIFVWLDFILFASLIFILILLKDDIVHLIISQKSILDRLEVLLKNHVLHSVFALLGFGLIVFIILPEKSSEAIRNLILLMGVLGGAYGIFLASIRQKTFSEQIDTAQKQLFNERLGRGVEALGHGSIEMHSIGIIVLRDLTLSCSPEQRLLIGDILLNFSSQRGGKNE